MWIARALAIAVLPVAVLAQEKAQQSDPSKLEIKLTGCVRGATLIETNFRVPGATDESPMRRWRLRAAKSLMKQIKQHEGRELEIVGTTKTAESTATGGRRIGNSNIYIGGDASRTTLRDPLPDLPTIDMQSFEPTGEPCR